MKAKISRGGGFLGALNYVFDVGPKATGYKLPEKVGGNMSGETVAELSKEFGITKKLRPDCKNPVWHCSLTLPEGDRLSSEKWGELAIDFMLEMGMSPSNFLYDVQRHRDTNFDHIHIVASRIGLDGQLWHGANDVFLAIEATQQLEKKHGLTLTQGFNSEHKAERKKVTHKEMNMAIRTGIKPPRMVCQEAIDSVLQSVGVMSAPQFIKRLDALGVRAVPSVASTGNMNGYSFETEGVAFTGSKLGESFKWAALQKRGVEYVKDRDFEELANARRLAAERARDTASAGPEQPALERDSEASSRSGAVAGAGGGPSDQGTGAIAIVARGSDEGPSSLRPGSRSTAIEPGSAGHRDEQSSGRGHGSEDRESQRSDNGPVNSGRWLAEQHASNAVEHREAVGIALEAVGNGDQLGQADAKRSERTDASSVLGQIDAAAGSVADAGQRRAGVALGGGWASRFQQASAIKRNTEKRRLGSGAVVQIDGSGKKVVERDRVEARAIDPTAYLESMGYAVTRQGRHLSVREHGEEVYRCTQKEDARWVTCDNYENGIGDNIALVQHLEPGTSFVDAVYRLAGSPSVAVARPAPAPAPVRQPPKMPAQDAQDVKRGRAYLVERGITLETIEAAEKAGMLRYSAGGVLFVGRDEAGTAQNIMRRAVDPSEAVQKRDLFGTDKRHPQMLRGATDTVWIVEGGIDALARHDIARRRGRPAPTVLVTGGANVKSWMQTPWVQAVLKLAKKVIVAFERESSAEVQIKTDAAHQVQMERLREVCGAEVTSWTPPEGVKDTAALNLYQVQQQQEWARQEAAQPARSYPAPGRSS